MPGELAEFVGPCQSRSRFLAVVSSLLRRAQSLLEMGIAEDIGQDLAKGVDGGVVGKLDESLEVNSSRSWSLFKLTHEVANDGFSVSAVAGDEEALTEVVDGHEEVKRGFLVGGFAEGEVLIEVLAEELSKAVIARRH